MSSWSSFEITATVLAVLAILVAIYFGIRSATKPKEQGGDRSINNIGDNSGTMNTGSMTERKD